jgi:hypothetical protein
MRDGGGHLAEGGESVAQPVALFHLLNAGQVLEEQRRPHQPPVIVVNPGEGVADGTARLAQAHFGAVGEVVGVEGALEDLTDFRAVVQDFGERPAEVARIGPQAEHPVPDIVDGGQRAFVGDGDDASAEVEDQVAEETVGVLVTRPGCRAVAIGRRGRCP